MVYRKVLWGLHYYCITMVEVEREKDLGKKGGKGGIRKWRGEMKTCRKSGKGISGGMVKWNEYLKEKKGKKE